MDEKKEKNESCPLHVVLDNSNVAGCRQKDHDCLEFELSPIQCTDDLSGDAAGSECSEYYSEMKNLALQKVDDCSLDLHLNVTQNQEIARKDYKKLWTDMVENFCTDRIDEEKQLPQKFGQSDESDRKLLGVSAYEEKVDNSELVLWQYLRKPVRKIQQHRVNQVYMLSMQGHIPNNGNKELSMDSSFPDDCHVEWNRLATYKDLPHAFPVFAIKLAQDGFVFRHDLNLVECIFCKLRIPLQEFGRPVFILAKIHQNKSPDCPFKRGMDCGNVPVPPVEEFQEPSNSRLSTSSDVSTGSEVSGQPVSSYAQSDGRSSGESLPGPPSQRGRTGEVYETLSLPESPVQQLISQGQGSEDGHTGKMASAASIANRSDTSSSKRSKKKQHHPAASASESTHSTNTTASRSSNSSRKASASNNSTSAVSGGAVREQSGTSSAGNTKGSKEEVTPHKLTYADLGIVSEKPKRADMANVQKRLASFEGKWKDTHTQTPKMLSEAGMYYAGYEDCARCFFCGGGLKNWDPPDNPWIEHARWFSKCAYLRMVKGPIFIEIVKKKNKDRVSMTLKEVEDEVGIKTATSLSSGSERSQEVTSNSGRNGKQRKSRNKSNPETDVSSLKDLERENDELKMNTSCKICMDEESSVVFLPCGHLVACTHCAIPLRNCPLCRAEIKGSVRANMA